MEVVTQKQLEEIKAHFDTKITSLEKNVDQKITSLEEHVDQKITSLEENVERKIKLESMQLQMNLKEFIRQENKKIVNEKTNSYRFWLGSIISPTIVAGLVLYFTKVLELF